MSKLEPKDFERYEAMILTDQMTADQVHFFLQDNKEFAHWYLGRVPARKAVVYPMPLVIEGVTLPRLTLVKP